MSDLDRSGRPDPPIAGSETETLLGFLDFQRATLAWKCSGLDAAGLRSRVGVSTMTLGGLLAHLARVEDSWFSEDFAGRPTVEDGDAWSAAADRDPQELRERWEASVARSRAVVAEALAGPDGLDAVARDPKPADRLVSLRWILVHMIEEYARHNGHADLLREAVDGETGE